MSLQLHLSKEQIEAELKRFQPMTPGWYEFEIAEVTAATAKDKVSMNYIVTHALTNQPDKTITHYFNSKPYGQTFMAKFFAALSGITLTEWMNSGNKEVNIDFEATKGKHVMCKVVQNLATDGSAKVFNNIDDWAPVGKVPF